MGHHHLHRRRPDLGVLAWAAVTLGLLALAVWAIVDGQVDCYRPGIVGPWC